MRRSFLLCCFWVLAVNFAFGQKGFHLGFRITPQASMVLDSAAFADSLMDPKPSFAINFGYSFGYHFNDYLGLEMNLLYAIQGYKGVPQTANNPRSDEYYKGRLNFVKIPLLLAFNSNPNKRVAFSGNLGISVNFFTGGRYKDNFLIKNNIDDEYILSDSDLRTHFQPITLGLTMGIGVKIRIVESIYADCLIRAEGDVTNLMKDKQTDKVSNFFMKSSSTESKGYTFCTSAGIMIGASYVFGSKQNKAK